MNPASLIITFKMGDAPFLSFTEHILQCFTNNQNFPAPVPNLNTLGLSITNYSNALAVAGKGYPKANNILKNDARAALESYLKQLANYAMGIADGDAAVLATTGFRLCKKKERITLLAKPTGLKIMPGPNKGSLKISVKKVERAAFYEFQIAQAGQGANVVWLSYPSTKRQTVITGLASGAEYLVRVAGAVATGDRVWSDEGQSFVL